MDDDNLDDAQHEKRLQVLIHCSNTALDRTYALVWLYVGCARKVLGRARH